MAHVILPHRWQRLPAHPVRVDWSNPLTAQMVALFTFPGYLWDAVRQRKVDPTVSTNFRPFEEDAGLLFTTGMAGLNTGINYAFSGTDPITIGSYQRMVTAVNAGAYFSQGTEIVLRGGATGTTGVEFIMNSFSTNDRTTVTATATMVGRKTTLLGSYGPSGNLTARVDGNVSSSVIPTGTYANPGSNYFVGDAGSLADCNTSMLMQFVAAREWNSDEYADWNSAPMQILRPLKRRIYSFAVAAPGGFQAAWASQRSRVIGAGVH